MNGKITVIGSGGVGSNLGFHLINRLSLKELVMVDISGDLARGTALDLEDTRGILGFSTEITGTEDLSHLENSDIVIITAGIARKEGMTRADLLKINGKIATDLAKSIKTYAPSAITIVVTNPLDIITYIVTEEIQTQRGKVIGMGASLDTSRLLNILRNASGISVSSLEAYVLGMHNKDMLVPLDRFKIKGHPLDKFIKKSEADKLRTRVQERGTEIVGFLKNKSACFAPSLACCKLIEAIIYDKNEVIPVSVKLNGEYGLTDVCAGVPCVINSKGAEKIIEIELTVAEKAEFNKVETAFAEFKTTRIK